MKLIDFIKRFISNFFITSTIIYVVVRLILWISDRKSAQRINERLRAIRDENVKGPKD